MTVAANLRNSSPTIGAPSIGSLTVFNDSCRFVANAIGTGDFIVAAAMPGHKTPEQALAIDGKTYHYFAQFNDQWEEGWGAYDWATDKLFRTKIIMNSLDTTSKINFTSKPIVDVFPSPQPNLEPGDIPSGSRMVFFNAAAPVGWTKVTDHNDKALRVVSGTGGGSGGSVAFSTVFSRTSTDGFTLTTSHIPSHNHSYGDYYPLLTITDGEGGAGFAYGVTLAETGRTTGSTGSGGSHSHGVEMRVTYVDVIICERN